MTMSFVTVVGIGPRTHPRLPTVSKAFICTTVKRNNKREGRKVARIAMLANGGRRNGDNLNFNHLNVMVFFNCFDSKFVLLMHLK
jgi:hypothetical protein